MPDIELCRQRPRERDCRTRDREFTCLARFSALCPENNVQRWKECGIGVGKIKFKQRGKNLILEVKRTIETWARTS